MAITKQVSNYDNDGECIAGGLYNDNNKISLGVEPPGYDAFTFFRFRSLSIEKAVSLVSAKLSLYYLGGTGSSVVRIQADDADNSGIITSSADFNSRTKTTAYVDWTLGSYSAGNWIDSPDIKSVIQEVIDREGWASGNALQLLITKVSGTGERYVSGRESGAANNPAILTLEPPATFIPQIIIM